MSQSEPRNPFYFLLLAVSFLFAMTAIASAVVLTAEQKSIDPAQLPAPWMQAVSRDGWKWLLAELAAMIVLGLLSMGLDHLRRLQKERALGTISPAPKDRPPVEDQSG
jgi:hypothetical protein